MGDNSNSKTLLESPKTESVSSNGTDVSKENTPKSTTTKNKSENKIPENGVQTGNCYWYFLFFIHN